MKAIITKQIGKSTLTFEIDGQKTLETLATAAIFTTTPDKCDVCHGTDVMLQCRHPEGFTYIEILCLNPECRATAKLGTYKDGSGHFWKKFERYVPGQQESAAPTAPAAPATPAAATPPANDDLPF